MKKLFLLLPILLLAIFSFAQQKTITGTVTGMTDKAPLTGVTVSSKGKTVLTDANGKFSIHINIFFRRVGVSRSFHKSDLLPGEMGSTIN